MLNSFFFMKRLFLNGLSEVTVRVWAGVVLFLHCSWDGAGFYIWTDDKEMFVLHYLSVWAFSSLSLLFSFPLQFIIIIIIISIIKVFLCQPRGCLTFTPLILSLSQDGGEWLDGAQVPAGVQTSQWPS